MRITNSYNSDFTYLDALRPRNSRSTFFFVNSDDNIYFLDRSLVYCFSRMAAEKEVAAAAGRDCKGSAGTSAAGTDNPQSKKQDQKQPADEFPGPSSLFLFSTDNPVRRYTKFIIEWPYPFLKRLIV